MFTELQKCRLAADEGALQCDETAIVAGHPKELLYLFLCGDAFSGDNVAQVLHFWSAEWALELQSSLPKSL